VIGARPDFLQILRFILVGGASTGVYFLLLWVFQGRVGGIVLLTALCYTVSMIFNYALQSSITFRAGPPTRRSMLRFAVMHLGAMMLNSALMAGLVEGLNVSLFPAQILVTAIISALVYMVSRQWVYHRG